MKFDAYFSYCVFVLPLKFFVLPTTSKGAVILCGDDFVLLTVHIVPWCQPRSLERKVLVNRIAVFILFCIRVVLRTALGNIEVAVRQVLGLFQRWDRKRSCTARDTTFVFCLSCAADLGNGMYKLAHQPSTTGA